MLIIKMKAERKNPCWEFRDLEECGLFSDVQLQQIRDVLDDVMINKKPEKVFTDSSNFEIQIYANGNMLVVEKDTGKLFTNKVRATKQLGSNKLS
jgi:hypothetical protein